MRAGNFVAHEEQSERDNFFHSIYEEGYKGLLIARCNQNGRYPWQTRVILEGLNAKASTLLEIASESSPDPSEASAGLTSPPPLADRAKSADFYPAGKAATAWIGYDSDGELFVTTRREVAEAWNGEPLVPLYASPAEPRDGWRLVPVEPTPAMIAAAWAAWRSRHDGKMGPGPAFVEAMTAMLAASPSTPATTDENEGGSVG